MPLILTFPTEAKQITGVGEARNRTRLAVERTVPYTSPQPHRRLVATELLNGTSVEHRRRAEQALVTVVVTAYRSGSRPAGWSASPSSGE